MDENLCGMHSNDPPDNDLPLGPGFWKWFWQLISQSIATLQVSVKLEQAPYLKISGLLIGLGMGLTQVTNYPDWNWHWQIAYILYRTVVGGVLYYYFYGFIFHLFILLAGGKGRMRDSQRIFLYANLPGHLCYIPLGALQLVLQNFPMSLPIIRLFGLMWIFSVIVLMVFQIKIFLIGAIKIQKARPISSIIFFVIAPLMYILLVMVQAFVYLN